MKNRLLLLTIVFILPVFGFTQLYVDSIPGEEIIKHKAYTLSYNESCEQANWVMYINTIDHIRNKVVDRKSSFKYDPLVSTKSAPTRDYSSSGYDRGHLAPIGDMLWNDTTMRESNYTSNISPQIPNLNRGSWLQLENKVRGLSFFQDSVYILTGPVLTGEMEMMKSVCVPKWFFKIISYKNNRVWSIYCFLLPNMEDDKQLLEYETTLEDIEKLTGLNFKMK